MTKTTGLHQDYDVLDKQLIHKVRKIRLLILDVDGVMTDGRIIMDDAGRETKNFNVKDGHGIKMLMRYGIDVILITGRRSIVVEHRARDLGIVEVHQGIHNKVEIFNEILVRRLMDREQVAFVGDDIVDIPVLKRVGFSVAVADATEDVKRSVDYTTIKNGGNGAVREVCEIILHCQDQWADVIQKYEIS
jgi:3-deoxy-D-manno-octulosonate 8-phosphate phosphatase (KDO 8-P phosphatase)